MLESHNKGQNKNKKTNGRKQMEHNPTYDVQSVNVNKAVFYV